MNDRVPYTYLIKHKPSNTVYYGCRFAKGCNPKDLWTTYYTSSKYVNLLIAKDGKDSFDIQVRRTFKNIDDCREWESRVLKRMNVIQNPRFINKSNNKSISIECCKYSNLRRSDEVKEKQKEIGKRIGSLNKGKKRTEEFKQRMKDLHAQGVLVPNYQKGYRDSDETRKKKSESKKGKPSNAVGNYQPVCSCLLCHKKLTSSTLKRHYDFHHLGISYKKSVERHSESTKYKFKVRRNKYINNNTIEILIEDYQERVEYLTKNPSFRPGRLLKKRGTQNS
jgi:hypothetical protein